jgi:hypothetical protein
MDVAIKDHFHELGWIHSWQDHDQAISGTIVLHLDVKRRTFNAKTGDPENVSNVEITCKLSGQLNEENSEFIASLEPQVYRNFSAKLDDKIKTSNLIRLATTIGGYLHLLCSTADIYALVRESVHTHRSESSDLQLALSLRKTLIWRIQKLVNELMTSIRSQYQSNPTRYASTIAYSACAVLLVEIKYFKDFLKHVPSTRKVFCPNQDWRCMLTVFRFLLASMVLSVTGLSHLRRNCGSDS